MAQTFEGVLPSLLQGVSQQIPRERQPGQLGEQVNMLSDPVTGIRRRAGALAQNTLDIALTSDDALFTAYIERGTDGRHLIINTQNGNWYLLSKDYTTIVNSGQSNYLIASIGHTSIQTANVAGLTYILNTEQAPVTTVDNTGKIDPSTTGFFRVTTVAFSKQWDITVTWTGGSTYNRYSSLAATDTDADLYASANFVANALANGDPNALLTTGIAPVIAAAGGAVYVEGGTIYISGLPNCVVSSSAGDTYCVFSNQSRVDEEKDLPATLPSAADGTMCRVGTTSSAGYTWYKFDYTDRTWAEDGAYNSITNITNMPLELAADDDIIVRDFEGRLSGDSENNDDPGFIQNGYITGIASFQGRLVLLSGPYVSLSASGLYQRFYRSSVTSLIDSDRIDISSASALNSVFRSAVQFNRDLVVIGDSMQAVIAGAANVTPTNASIAITSEIICDSRVYPIIAGQTLLYPNRRSDSYAGVQEFVPSAYTSSQYVSQDATVHIPKYIPGRIMKMVVSTVTNMGFCMYNGERSSLLVHEYLWGADAKKAQSAFHKWTLPSNVLSVHVSPTEVVLFLRAAAGGVLVATVDPREGFVAQGTYDAPYIDLYSTVTVSSRAFSVPDDLQYSGLTADDFVLVYSSGDAAGQSLGIASINTGTWAGTTVRGVPDGTYYLGLRYESAFTPTPPMMKDSNDNLIGSGHVRLLRFDVAIKNSGAFTAEVTDTSRDVDSSDTYSGLILNSSELSPGLPLKVSQANIIIPCRTVADSTEVRLSTSDTLELNVLDISYILRYNQRRQRV